MSGRACIWRYVGQQRFFSSRPNSTITPPYLALDNPHFFRLLASLTVLPVSSTLQELRAEVNGSQSYDVERIDDGTVGENNDPLPLSDIGVQSNKNARLEGDCTYGPGGDSTQERSIWARTSLTAFLNLIANVPIDLVVAVRYKLAGTRPSYLVVFGLLEISTCALACSFSAWPTMQALFCVVAAFFHRENSERNGTAFRSCLQVLVSTTVGDGQVTTNNHGACPRCFDRQGTAKAGTGIRKATMRTTGASRLTTTTPMLCSPRNAQYRPTRTGRTGPTSR